jgi:hypothetical protein
MTSRLTLKVYDEDTFVDEVIGAILLDVKSLLESESKFFWANIYGAPLDGSGKMKKMMNENPEMGSVFKGRILM